ncbi:MAG: FAD-dependent monooxygenase [Acidobacteria bacterium]|nr:FAD-dependent monooxygenase [Acidobacteriota bacterium]
MRIVIVGGGIGGLSAALALRREGFEPQVFEQAPALLEVGAGLAVWPNAMRVLSKLGVAEAVFERGGQLKRARWLDSGGRVFKHFSFEEDDAPAVALHRADLQGALLRALPPDSLHLGKVVRGYECARKDVRADFADGESVNCDLLVGADGLHSRVRAQMLGEERPVYRGYTVWRGITSLEHTALAPDTATEIYGGGRRFGIGPVGRGRTGWWATANEAEEVEESASEHRGKLLRLFGGWCAPVTELVEATATESILRTATYDRAPVRPGGEKNVTLLGDAWHPLTPNLGQGGCMALEDAAVLARCLAKCGDADRALRRYEALRYARTATVVRYSRRYGAVGQWQSATAVRFRGALLSALPERVGRSLLSWVFDYDAYGVDV